VTVTNGFLPTGMLTDLFYWEINFDEAFRINGGAGHEITD
jgi:hypothetical protein